MLYARDTRRLYNIILLYVNRPSLVRRPAAHYKYSNYSKATAADQSRTLRPPTARTSRFSRCKSPEIGRPLKTLETDRPTVSTAKLLPRRGDNDDDDDDDACVAQYRAHHPLCRCRLLDYEPSDERIDFTIFFFFNSVFFLLFYYIFDFKSADNR